MFYTGRPHQCLHLLITWKFDYGSLYKCLHLVFDQEVTQRIWVVLENKKKKKILSNWQFCSKLTKINM